MGTGDKMLGGNSVVIDQENISAPSRHLESGVDPGNEVDMKGNPSYSLE